MARAHGKRTSKTRADNSHDVLGSGGEVLRSDGDKIGAGWQFCDE